MASSSRDRLVHVYDMEQNYGLLQTLDDHSASVTSVNFVENDDQLKILSCSADKSLLFRNAQMVKSQFYLNNKYLLINHFVIKCYAMGKKSLEYMYSLINFDIQFGKYYT